MEKQVVVEKTKMPTGPKPTTQGGGGGKQETPKPEGGLDGAKELAPEPIHKVFDVGAVDSTTSFFDQMAALGLAPILLSLPVGASIALEAKGNIRLVSALGIEAAGSFTMTKVSATEYSLAGALGFGGGLDVSTSLGGVLDFAVKAGVIGKQTIQVKSNSIIDAWFLFSFALDHHIRTTLEGYGAVGRLAAWGLTGSRKSYLERLDKALALMDAMPDFDEALYATDEAYKEKIDLLRADAETITITTESGLAGLLSMKIFGFGGSANVDAKEVETQTLTRSEQTDLHEPHPTEEYGTQPKWVKAAFLNGKKETQKIHTYTTTLHLGPLSVAYSSVTTDGVEVESIKIVGEMDTVLWVDRGADLIVDIIAAVIAKKTGEGKVSMWDLGRHFPAAAVQGALTGLAKLAGLETKSKIAATLSGDGAGGYTLDLATQDIVQLAPKIPLGELASQAAGVGGSLAATRTIPILKGHTFEAKKTPAAIEQEKIEAGLLTGPHDGYTEEYYEQQAKKHQQKQLMKNNKYERFMQNR